MGAICNTMDSNLKKILLLKKRYPLYHQEDKTFLRKKDNLKILKSLEIKLMDNCKTFVKYKTEIQRTEKPLYEVLFPNRLTLDSSPEDVELQVSNISSDNEPKFLFFFNKGGFTKVRMSQCFILFPKVSID